VPPGSPRPPGVFAFTFVTALFAGKTSEGDKQMSAEPKATPAQKLKVNEEKWTKPLMDAGWTVIPSVIIERQRALGLDAIDINIIMHLALHWWTADNKPWPSKGSIADALNVDPRTVQRRLAKLEAAKFILREERRIAGRGSKTNRYHLDGLIAAAKPYADEKLAESTEHAEAKAERVKRKRAKIRVVGSSDGES
jgi:DNA-binding Lrp family transcriptional regulator